MKSSLARLAAPANRNTTASHHQALLDLLKINTDTGSRRAGRSQATRRVRSLAPMPLPPRTGTLVGRSVDVNDQSQLPLAVRRVNILNKINAVPRTARLQQYHERPGKARLRVQIERKHREFNDGIRRLFGLAQEVRRKGY